MNVTTETDLVGVLDRVAFRPSCVNLDWRWQVRAVTGEARDGDGWLVRVGFVRPDTETGAVERGWGRWEFVAKGTSESGVVKTCWLLVDLIVRHELMEAFTYDGVRVFDPHHSVDDLKAAAASRAAREGR